MTLKNYIFTSESVSEGHPDKVCDRISDALLDVYLAQNPNARVAIETAVTTDQVILLGEVKGCDNISAEQRAQIVRDTIKDIGYDQEGFHWETCNIRDLLHNQSDDISIGVDQDSGLGAGDQGMMIGYAIRETQGFLPASIYYSHRILENICNARKDGMLNGIEPDAKVQLTVGYKDSKPTGIEAVVLSTQHSPNLSQDDVREMVRPYIENTLPENWMCSEDNFFVNPTGRFVIGGPVGDAGLTGRKIIVDTYGAASGHGGGAFSGKDPSKVDRSGAYMMRYLAKNIVAANLAQRCTTEVAYGIGLQKPLSLFIDTHGTGVVDEEEIVQAVQEMVDLSPAGILKHLDLNRPIYSKTAAYGHFGRIPTAEGHFSWEKADLALELAHRFSTKVDEQFVA